MTVKELFKEGGFATKGQVFSAIYVSDLYNYKDAEGEDTGEPTIYLKLAKVTDNGQRYVGMSRRLASNVAEDPDKLFNAEVFLLDNGHYVLNAPAGKRLFETISEEDDELL